MITKPWYLSKTLWWNIISIVVFTATYIYNAYNYMGYAIQIYYVLGAVIAAGNFILRLFTDTGIKLPGPGEKVE
jgi:hypothetical protein